MEQLTYTTVPNEGENQRVPRKYCTLLLVFTVVAVCVLIAGIALLTAPKNVEKARNELDANKVIDMGEYCEPSEEAKRIKLNRFLEKCQKLYFKLFPSAELNFQVSGILQMDQIARRFTPYLPTPQFLKDFADQISALKEEVNGLKAEQRKMKPKEAQILAEIRVFLDQFMAEIYDIDFYGGDWMLGPNYFCMNRICKLKFDIEIFLTYFQLKTTEDIYFVIRTFHAYEKTFDQYRSNVQLGVTTGMVKSQLSCKAGANAMREYYSGVIIKKDGGAEQLIPGYFTTAYLPKDIRTDWEGVHNETVRMSLKRAWMNGFVKPLLGFINYLEETHIRHCPPDDVASGVSSLPLDYVYLDGVPDKGNVTTKKLPITNGTLDGKELYRKIVPRFTTTDISPEKIYAEGGRQLKIFYAELISATKAYTKETDEKLAVKKMKEIMEGDDQWHGETKFPKNESNENAYKTCTNDTSARKHCPVRWNSIQKWESTMYGIMGMIHPKLNKVFHFTGDKVSVPSCPIQMIRHYNPSNGAMYFDKSDSECTKPCVFALPFFLAKYGPKYQEWSVNGHEGRPGHHLQYQGMFELFPYPCSNGVSSFFHRLAYCTSFIEGWALYGEHPLLAQDIDLYKDNPLQKIGMYKWLIWRAVRLLVDSGLHYKNQNRTWALHMFEKYTWDKTDFGSKEVTRYMSCPGQATAYMIGRLTILKAREKAKRELGSLFNIKDFHYQVLSLGQAPLDYLLEHIDRYISCMKDSSLMYCGYMLTPVHAIPKDRRWVKLPTRRHYP